MKEHIMGEAAPHFHESLQRRASASIELPRHNTAAHVIRDDKEAIEIAHRLAERFAQESALRDRERRLPFQELEEFSQSGLWGITVPKEYGGAGVSNVTLAEVTAIIAAADSSLGQIPQNHFYMVEAVRLDGDEVQKKFYFERVLAGERFGNAFCELGTRTDCLRFPSPCERAKQGVGLKR
jgi:alkylation response protein AidB-like acyl-CoA dehydrogenase